MIVAARRYCPGLSQPAELVVDGLPSSPSDEGAFDWVGLVEPDAEEMRKVQAQFGLHPLAVEDALNARQLPKVDIYGEQLFVVARTAVLGRNEEITYGQTAFFLGDDFLVTVRLESKRSHEGVRRMLEGRSERLAEGPDYVLHAVLDFIVDGYQPIMDQLDDIAIALEEAAIDAFPDQLTIRRIFRLRRVLRRFERVVGPMVDLCERLSTQNLPGIDPGTRIWLRDVHDHIRRVMARLVGLKEVLAAIVETASLLEQHRQGDMTRQLAAWAAILAVPTAIAGIYGMNFDYIPELKWHYGYFMVLGGIATVCGGLYARFRQIGWL
ncbi:Mg2+ transporter protein, CorA-like protein [Novosphingobium nitrogenifigens DSM 19370]|uniref:Mg2+ transporter protein, CorA-like protein n=1 Tax=Novosphingobium nitrogenifigens DSM 19370 TaxID=983920 RepID=F1Z5Z7_9SPHN|nr:magnesium and cobalt transport protein CorA [Novosphingobium nitrogenifigens]EGD59961.1 Mg2+ transporter protein, CorA-like protein [Novosphingobium nitrogenifigens DSM 19370]